MIEQYKEMLREKRQQAMDGPLTGRQRRSGVTREEASHSNEDGPMYAVNQYGEEIELTLDNIHSPKIKDLFIFRIPFWIVKVVLMVFPKGVREAVLAMDIFESIRPVDEEEVQAEADSKRKVRKAELAKKRAAKRAQQKNSPSVSDDEEEESHHSSEEGEEALAARAKEEELIAARRRRRVKAPGQASLKGGRRG